MKIRMRCTYIAIMAVSLTAMEARAQVVTAPKAPTSVMPIPGQTLTAPATALPPIVVQFSLLMAGAAPPGYVGSFRAFSVDQRTVPGGSREQLNPTLYAVITRRPDGYSTLFKQLVNQGLDNSSTLTVYRPYPGATRQGETILTRLLLTSMTAALDTQNQPLETLTFQYVYTKGVQVPVP